MCEELKSLLDTGQWDRAVSLVYDHRADPEWDVWVGLDTFHELTAYEVNLRTSEIRRKDGRFGSRITTRLEKHGKYQVCTLRTSRGPKVVFVHRAVLHAFRGMSEDPDKTTVDHIDGNPQNNMVWNLRYASSKDQNQNRPNRPTTYARRIPFDMTTERLKDEEFRPFPGSNVLVSNKGRIIYEHPQKTYKIRSGPDQLSKGYPVVNVKGKLIACHRLVAHVFLGLDVDTDARIVMHIRPHSTLDYSVDNLKLGSLSENAMASAGDNTRRLIPVHVYRDALHMASYTSIAATSRATGVNTGRISSILKNSQKAWSPILQGWCTFEENRTARTTLDMMRCEKTLQARQQLAVHVRPQPTIVAENPQTGQVLEFKTVYDAAVHVKRHYTSINTAIRKACGGSTCAGLVWRVL